MADMLPLGDLSQKSALKFSPEVSSTGPFSPALGESTSSKRRPSLTPPILVRRGLVSMPALPMPSPVHRSSLKRPGITPLQTGEQTSQGTPRSQRSVRFDEYPPMGSVVGPPALSFQSNANLLPPDPVHTRAPAQLFGRRTRYRPLWLLALGNSGTCIFGSGEVVLQRAIWPAKQYAGVNPVGQTSIPAGEAGTGQAFGSLKNDVIGGTILMAIGVAAALTASSLFVMDGRRLNRRQNPAQPNYRRTMGYFYAHLVGIGLLIGHRFAIEAFRIYLSPRWQWVAAVPGALGQAIFAVTQAQSFSSCEVYNGRMPLKHRGAISAIARAGVSGYVLLAAIIGTPNFSAYIREATRLFAQTSTAVAYSLPLTTARLTAPPVNSPRVEHGGPRYRGDWTAIQIFGVYALARLISMLGAYWLDHTRWPVNTDDAHHPAYNNSNSTEVGWYGLPPPFPSGAADWDGVSCASFLLTGATLLGMYAFYQFRKDAQPPAWRANLLFALATLCLVLGQLYRTMTEDAKSHANFQRVWEAMPVGVAANAIAFVVLPEMFSRSEVTRGNAIIPYRYQVTEGCRAVGNLAWTLWAAMSGILGFPPLARMMMNWCGSIFSILGMSLPDADTRRMQTGSLGTPQGEPTSWLAAHTSSR